jgi:hypothetical protein
MKHNTQSSNIEGWNWKKNQLKKTRVNLWNLWRGHEPWITLLKVNWKNYEGSISNK